MYWIAILWHGAEQAVIPIKKALKNLRLCKCVVNVTTEAVNLKCAGLFARIIIK